MPNVSRARASACAALALILFAMAVPAAAQSFETLFVDFSTACVSGTLPAGWQASPGTQVVCGPNGIGATGSTGDNKLYSAIFAPAANRLRTGHYMLTAAGAGAMVRVKNGFGDQGYKARTRIVNLSGGATPIVNSIEFDWDEAAEPNGLLEVWGSSLQWMRLEQQQDHPVLPALPRPTASNANGWAASPGTSYTAVPGTALVKVANPSGTARLTQNLDLGAGRYTASVTTRGNVNVVMTSGPGAGAAYASLDEQHRTGPGTSRTFSHAFNASGQRITLSLAANTPGQAFSLGDITIAPLVEATPAPATLAASRPSPWPARGTTVAAAYDLMPATPLDRYGQPCARDYDRSAALADIKSWGAGIVRMEVQTIKRARLAGCPLLADEDIHQDGSVDAAAFWDQAWPVILEETQRAVQAAADANLKVVLLIDPPTPTIPLGARSAGWVSLQAHNDYARGVAELVERLAPLRSHVWAYDLYNEPYEFREGVGNLPASQWRNLAIELIKAVRDTEDRLQLPETDRNWVVFEPGLFPSGDWWDVYRTLKPLPDSHVIYSDHYYDPFEFTHQNIPEPGMPQATLAYSGSALQVQAALRPLQDFSQRTGAPVYLGEFGAAVWAGWSPVAGSCGACPCGDWQPRRDTAGQPIYDNVNWLRDVMKAANALGLAWTQHSFRTAYAWDSEITPTLGPCSSHEALPPGSADTPTMSLMKRYLPLSGPEPLGRRSLRN